MAAAPERPAQAQHRRETLLWIILPVAGAGLVILAVLGVTLLVLLPRRAQVSILADWLLTVLVLCPVLLCLFPVCVLLVTAVFGMNRLHGKTERLMGKAGAMSETLVERTLDATETISKKSIDFNVKLAHLEPLWRMFDEDEDGKHNP
jgi:lysylphosphatidylglycerol synthetase-like protein (DUF2156 family)